MSTTSMIDVLVVGAGPAGLTLACDLARYNKTIRIIDKLKVAPVGTRARGISPRSQEIFADLEILASLTEYAEPSLPWRIYNQDNQIVREIDHMAKLDPSMRPSPTEPYPLMLQVSQRYTDAILRDCLASYGIYVEWDCQLVNFKEHTDYVIAEVEHAGKSEVVQARYLVGCDGGHSQVRRCSNIPFRGETLDDPPSIIANVTVKGLDPNYWHFWDNQPLWRLTLQPMIKDHTWLFSTNLTPDQYDTVPVPELETLQRLFDEQVGLPDVQFSHLTWFSSYRHNARLAECYHIGRVFLTGDAAHVGIAGGQGMNTAIQDAYNLGWKLAYVLDGAPDGLLDTYQDERLPVAQRFLTASTAYYAKSSAPLSGEQSIKKLQNTVTDLSQLNISYQDSKLSCDLDQATSIRSGSRAPDAPCMQALDNKQIRLFDVFRGTHFTLLAFGGQPISQLPDNYCHSVHTYTIIHPDQQIVPDQHTLIDSEGYIYRVYGVTENALILIRPDGYIGLTAGTLNIHPIVEYLHNIIG